MLRDLKKEGDMSRLHGMSPSKYCIEKFHVGRQVHLSSLAIGSQELVS
jgi:hypothetical protein